MDECSCHSLRTHTFLDKQDIMGHVYKSSPPRVKCYLNICNRQSWTGVHKWTASSSDMQNRVSVFWMRMHAEALVSFRYPTYENVWWSIHLAGNCGQNCSKASEQPSQPNYISSLGVCVPDFSCCLQGCSTFAPLCSHCTVEEIVTTSEFRTKWNWTLQWQSVSLNFNAIQH